MNGIFHLTVSVNPMFKSCKHPVCFCRSSNPVAQSFPDMDERATLMTNTSISPASAEDTCMVTTRNK